MTKLNIHNRLRTTTSVLAFAILAAAAGSVSAQASGQTARASRAPVAVSAPAGDLSTALAQYSRASGLQVIADPALLRGRRTQGVAGTLTPRQAMDRLLRGTGLNWRLNGDAVVIMRGAQTRTAAPAAPTARPVEDASRPFAELEEVVVTGSFSSSLTQALDVKRRADNVVDVITAEDIGEFPSQNIAEALQRVPGVSIVRDRGEGLFVRVRGLGANFQITTLNGRSAAVNENVRDSGQSGRQFRFDTLPSELVAGVDVIKSPMASLDEGAIGGVVNVRTFRPLDLKTSRLAMSGDVNYSENADELDPRLSTLGSWVNEDRTFGALLAAVYDRRSLRQDRITGVTWNTYAAGLDTDGDGVRDTGSIIYPQALRPTLETEDRERYGLNAALQWRPTATTDVNLDVTYTDLTVDYDELTYSADFNIANAVPGTARVENGALVGGVFSGGTSQIGREVSHLHHDNLSVGLNLRQELGDWVVSGDLAYARAASDTPKPITRSRVLGPVGRIEFDLVKSGDGVPSINFLDADLTRTSTLPGRRLEYRVNDTLDEETAFQLDLQRPVSLGPIASIAFGAKYRERARDYNRRDFNITRGIAGVTLTPDFFVPFTYTDFLSKVGADLPRAWAVPNPTRFLQQITQADLDAPLSRSDLRNSYQIDETILAGYGMADVEATLFGSPLRGNIGVRVAQTDQTSSGHADNGRQALPVSFDKTYTDVLPSLNLVWEATGDLQFRVAAAKVITRPSLSDLAPRLTLNSSGTVLTAVGGNPELKPFEAWQYDAVAEWYFSPSSALIGGVFYKDITTFSTRRRSNIDIDGVIYELTAPVNGGTASIAGMELAYQQLFPFLPAPFDGLGVTANVTLVSSDATYYDGTREFTDELENVAKESANLTGFYEKGPFAARLSYSWRGDVLQQVGTNGLESANDRAFGSLDGSMTYKLTDQLTVSLEAINLTDEPQEQFVADDRFVGYTDYGRTVSVGVSARF
jgi:TonB-dependent receptor